MTNSLNNNKNVDTEIIKMINNHDLDGAIIKIDSVLRVNPNNLDYLHYLGMVFYLKGDEDLADKTYARALDIAHDRNIILKLHLETLTRIGKHNKAFNIISKYKDEVDMNDVGFLHQYALIYSGLKDFENAKIFFIKAIRKDKTKPYLLYHYGFFLNSIGKHSLAIKNYLRAIIFFKKDLSQLASIYYNLSSSYSALMDKDNALIYINKLLKLDNKNINAKKKKAMILSQMQKFEEAISIVDDVIKENENDIDCFVLLSRFYFLATDYLKSVKAAKKALTINETNIDARLNLASSLINLKRYSEAEEECLKGLKLDNNNVNLLMNISTLYTEIGDFDKSLVELEKLKNIEPDNSTLNSLYPYICEQLGIEKKLDYLSEPIEFVSKYNLIEDGTIDKKEIVSIKNYCEKLSKRWEPKERTTQNGYQTDSIIFEKSNKDIMSVKETIYSYIKRYLLDFKDKDDLFIRNYPKLNKIEGWCVFLKESGHQTSHNHPSGWLSGCLYLDIPKKLQNDQGSIEFSYHGYNFPILNPKISKLLIKPSVGDLILFPSTLFHKTIPFSGKRDRVSIAFDIYPSIEN